MPAPMTHRHSPRKRIECCIFASPAGHSLPGSCWLPARTVPDAPPTSKIVAEGNGKDVCFPECGQERQITLWANIYRQPRDDIEVGVKHQGARQDDVPAFGKQESKVEVAASATGRRP